MNKPLLTIALCLSLLLGGFALSVAPAQADCGKCGPGAAAPKVCEKCRKAGKKTCDCQAKPTVCEACRKAGKKTCGCKH